MSSTRPTPATASSTALTNNLLGLASQTTSGSRTSYTRAPDGTLLAQRGPTSTQYVITDNLGSTRGLFTATSTTIDREYSYDPDGNGTSTGTGATTAIKFAGGHDVGSGLYHFGQRHYDPGTARWTQQDALFRVADLGQANLFVYVGGDPLNAIDPSGAGIFRKLAATAVGAVGVLAGAGLAGACIAATEGIDAPHCLMAGVGVGTLGVMAAAAIEERDD